MLYMMQPLDRHFDLGFGAVADSFKDAADSLCKFETAPSLHAHLPVSFLYRHAIELYLKSAIIIFHRKLDLPYGDEPSSSEPRVLIGEKWKPMYNVHAVQPLYSYVRQLFSDHSDYLQGHTSTDWSFPAELSDWITEIDATDSSSTFFRYPVTRHGEKDKEKSAIRRDSYDNIMSSLIDGAKPVKTFLIINENDDVVDVFRYENENSQELISVLRSVSELLSDCHAALTGELTGGN